MDKPTIKHIATEILIKAYPVLSIEDAHALLSISTYMEVKNKEVIIRAGERSKMFFFILEGTFRGYYLNKQDEEVNIFLRQDPCFFGPPDSLTADQPTKFTLESILPAKILLFNINDLETLAYERPNIFKLYVAELKAHLQNLVYRIESLIDKQPQERYEDLLAKHPKLFQAAFNKHIANFLGVTPVSLSRIMKRLKNSPLK